MQIVISLKFQRHLERPRILFSISMLNLDTIFIFYYTTEYGWFFYIIKTSLCKCSMRAIISIPYSVFIENGEDIKETIDSDHDISAIQPTFCSIYHSLQSLAKTYYRTDQQAEALQ